MTIGDLKMNRNQKIERIIRLGYKIVILGKNIRAIKGSEVVHGNVSKVHRCLYGY